jgi:hypothetical protein
MYLFFIFMDFYIDIFIARLIFFVELYKKADIEVWNTSILSSWDSYGAAIRQLSLFVVFGLCLFRDASVEYKRLFFLQHLSWQHLSWLCLIQVTIADVHVSKRYWEVSIAISWYKNKSLFLIVISSTSINVS